DLLAFRVLEALTVFLEELVRSALAFDSDEQRLLVVDALAQLFGAAGEQAAGRALEEQERGPRVDLRTLAQPFLVSLLERAQMVAVVGGEGVEDDAGGRVGRDPRRAGVKLEAAALGRDCHPQRVACEQELRGSPVDGSGLLARTAFLARAVNLHDGLR